MTKTRRRKKTAPPRKRIGFIWWLAGAFGLGWVILSANPELANTWRGKVTQVTGLHVPRVPAANPAPQKPAAATRTQPATTASTQVPTPEPRRAVAPQTRPATSITAATVKLYAQPTAKSDIRTTIAAGRAIRIVESKGDWRRIEAGIFTGWVPADSVRQLSVTRTATSTRTRAPAPQSAPRPAQAAMKPPAMPTAGASAAPRPQAEINGR